MKWTTKLIFSVVLFLSFATPVLAQDGTPTLCKGKKVCTVILVPPPAAVPVPTELPSATVEGSGWEFSSRTIAFMAIGGGAALLGGYGIGESLLPPTHDEFQWSDSGGPSAALIALPIGIGVGLIIDLLLPNSGD